MKLIQESFIDNGRKIEDDFNLSNLKGLNNQIEADMIDDNFVDSTFQDLTVAKISQW